MPKPKILQEDQSYTFRSYFEMPYEVDQVLAELGYEFVSDTLELPKTDRQLAGVTQLRQEIEASLQRTECLVAERSQSSGMVLDQG